MRLPRFRSSVILLALSAALLKAQGPELHGPVCGFLFDPPTSSIRPLLGIPGSAYLGPPLLEGLTHAWTSPDGQKALAVSDSRVQLIANLPGLVSSQLLSDAIEDPSRAVWAQDSTAAVLYSASTGLLQRLRFPPEGPSADPPINLSGLGEALSALAIDSGGQRIFAAAGGTGGGVFLVTPGQPPMQMAALDDPRAVAFFGDRVYAANHEQIIVMPAAAPAAAEIFLEIKMDPAGLAFSRDGRLLYLADRSSQTLRIFDRDARSLNQEIPLDVPPTSLELLAEPASLFLLNTRTKDGEPVLLLDIRSDPQVYFVPAPPAATLTGGGEN